MTEHSAQVEALLADYRRSRDQLTSVRHELASVRASASSSDGLVTASAGPHGGLLELSIAEGAYQRYRPAELSALIVRTTAAAARQAAEQASQVLAPVLPAGSDPALFLAEPPEPAVPVEPAPVDDELDENLEDRSWLDDAPRRPV